MTNGYRRYHQKILFLSQIQHYIVILFYILIDRASVCLLRLGLKVNGQVVAPQHCVNFIISEFKASESNLRCFDIVFQRSYRYFSIALHVIFSQFDRYKIFTSNWLQIEICENVVLSKIDITTTTTEIDKSRILCDLDLSSYCYSSNLKFGVQQITSVRSKKFCML